MACVMDTFSDVLFIQKHWRGGKSTHKLEATVAFDEWAAIFERERGFMFPAFLPLKIVPRDWDSQRHGGYYTPKMQKNFIKTRGKIHKDFVYANPPERHIAVVNKLQKTSWCINKQVLEVQKIVYEKGLAIGVPSSIEIKPPPFPEHLREVAKTDLTTEQQLEVSCWKEVAKREYDKERKRKGQVIAFTQSFRLAKELEDWEEFYYVYTTDFRGRIYCATAGLSPQGADSSKGLLLFKEGVELGESGIKWLAIHGSNTYGVDKVSFEERVAFIKSEERHIRAVVDDPISSREYWGNADKPYQFLAFCFEWVACDCGRLKTFKSQIPVGQDGSCNGLQHYSAILRDSVGAYATNLTKTDKPQDIYAQVAVRCVELLKDIDDPRARKWLKVGVNRKLAKKPVMTLPYGATKVSARQAILDYVDDNWSKFNLDEKYKWEFAKFLTPILWDAIGDVVIAARVGMKWLQQNSGKYFAHWLTPIGFPVFQFYSESSEHKIKTQINGGLTLKLHQFDKDVPANPYGQRNGIAPNFIHSLDSTHLVTTVEKSNFISYSMVHDDFGCHAGNAEILAKDIRIAFKELYENHDVLNEWITQVKPHEDIETPECGDYKIEEILDANYFFG